MLPQRDLRVAVCGTSCTGKTTLANTLYRHPRLSWLFRAFIPEGIQGLLAQNGLSFASMTLEQTRAFQLRYIDWKTKAESVPGSWLADRSFVDVAAVWIERDANDNALNENGIIDSCRALCTNYSCLIHVPRVHRARR